jgi:hypothetical protein
LRYPIRLKRLHYIDFSVDYAKGFADLQRTLLAAEIIQPRDLSKSPKVESPAGGLAKPVRRRQFVVEGTRGWQGTGMQMDHNDVAKIVYLAGTWRDPETGERINPNHLRPEAQDSYDCLPVRATSVAYGGLIAKVGENVLPVDALNVELAGEGELLLRSNSCDAHLLEYCDGSVTVEIEVSQPLYQ